MSNLKSDLRISQKNESYLIVDSDDRGILMELSDFFTFRVPGYQFMPSYRNKMWDGNIRLYNTKTKEIYVGLYKHILKFAEAKGREYSVESTYDLNEQDFDVDQFINSIHYSSKSKKINPYDEQKLAIEHSIQKKRALIVSPTASGKSLIIYSIVRWFLANRSGKLLIIVPTTSLVEQMYSDFEDYSEFDSGYDNESTAHRIYSGKDKQTDKRVLISTWQSIYRLQGKYFEDFSAVIGDEAHQHKATSLVSIMTKLVNADIRIGTTGTLDGTLTNELVLQGLFGPIKTITTTKKLIEKGNLAELNISILALKYADDERKYVSKLDYQNEIDYIVRCEKRNKFIRNLALDQKGNTLILFQFVDKHGKPLYEMIKERIEDNRKLFYVSGETDAKTREEIRKITETESNAILVCSFGTFSTGVNIKNIHNIIFASPSKSQIRILQSIGRGLRKSDDGRATALYDLVDDLSWKKKENFALKHGKERIKLYGKQQFPFKLYEVPI